MDERPIKRTRETITIPSMALRDLVYEDFLVINGKNIPVEEIRNEYDSTGRHQEYWTKIFKRLKDNKYFSISYSNSVKDTMGWFECNIADEYEAQEVFPETVSKVIYK